MYLSELPRDADGPAEAVAADQQGLHAPTPEMAKCEDIKMTQDSLPRDNMTVHGILLIKNKQNKTASQPGGIKVRKETRYKQIYIT